MEIEDKSFEQSEGDIARAVDQSIRFFTAIYLGGIKMNVKLGIIGFRRHGSVALLKTLLKIQGVEIIAACDIKEDRIALIEEAPIKCYRSADALLDDEEINTVLFDCAESPSQRNGNQSRKSEEETLSVKSLPRSTRCNWMR